MKKCVVSEDAKVKFRNHCRELYKDQFNGIWIGVYCDEQIRLVEAGIRDIRLSDNAIILLDGLVR